MYFNEFFSTEFVYFQFKHGFNRVTILKKVKPSLVLVSNEWEIYRNQSSM
jgi:hypothetical protein